MLAAIGMVSIIMNITGGASPDIEFAGMMPEIVISAPRFEGEDVAYSGMMPEIVVTAPRFAEEDHIFGSMMPEIIVVAEQYDRTIADIALIRFFRCGLSLGAINRYYIVGLESRHPRLYY